MKIKGFGNIKIQKNNGDIETIEFTNTIHDPTEVKIGEIFHKPTLEYFPLTEHVINIGTSLDGTTHMVNANKTELNSTNGTCDVTWASDVITFKWDTLSNTTTYITGVQNQTTASIDAIDLHTKFKTGSSLGSSQLTGYADDLSTVVFDFNDHVQSVSYSMQIILPSSGGSVSSVQATRRLMHHDHGNNNITVAADLNKSSVPTKIQFLNASDQIIQVNNSNTLDISSTNTYTNGSISSVVDIGFTGTHAVDDDPPTKYKLFTESDMLYDSGNITLVPAVGEGVGEVPWLAGDTINFSYTTSSWYS